MTTDALVDIKPQIPSKLVEVKAVVENEVRLSMKYIPITAGTSKGSVQMILQMLLHLKTTLLYTSLVE